MISLVSNDFWAQRVLRAFQILCDTTRFPDVQIPEPLQKAQKAGCQIEVNVFFVDDTTIQSLNAEWRDKESVTDILSFPLFENDDDFPLVPDMPCVLGELFICESVCAQQAQQWNHSIEAETEFLLVHGLLHLLGYDHETSPEDEKRMFDIQNRLIQSLESQDPIESAISAA